MTRTDVTLEESVNPLNRVESEGSRSGTGRGRDRRARATSRQRTLSSDAEAAFDLPAGAEVGRYVLTRTLGRGAMGVVYAAYDPELDRRIAIKLLSERVDAQHEAGRARLMREAQSMAAFSHPNVVRIHGAGVHEGQVYIAMEYVAGTSLRAWENERPRSWREVLGVFVGAGRGLAAAHEAGLIHRDFKPDNVLVTEDGQAKVGDFGLARAAGRDEASLDDAVARAREVAVRSGLSRGRALDADLTRTGAAVGTPAYMSPEQHAALPLDASTDQFSYCVALFEALYGRRPFERRTVQEIARAKARGEIAAPPKRSAVPEPVAALVMRGLAADPKHRHASMTELVDALERTAVDHDRPRARRWVAGLGGASVLAIALGVWMWGPVGAHSSICHAGGDPFAGVWDDEREARVAAALAARELPFADAASRRFADAVDAYVERWKTSRLDACEQTRLAHVHDERWFDATMVCLDRRRADLGTLLARIEAAPADRVAAVLAQVDDLRPPRGCLGPAIGSRTPTTERPMPDDPEQAERVSQLRVELDEVRGQRRLGARGPARAHARQVADEARTLDFDPLTAEALELLASVQPRTGAGPKQRAALLHQSAQAALRSGHDEALGRAWVQMVDAASRSGELDTAERWLAYASRVVRRHPTPELEADLAGVTVWLAIMKGEVERANAAALRELEIVERDFGPRHARVVEALNHLGVAAYYDHRKDDALTNYRKALSVGEIRHGPRSPEVSPMLNNIGVVLTDQGKYGEAVTYYERSLEIRQLNLAPDDPSLLQAYDNLAELLARDRQWPRALPYCRKVVEMLPGPPEPVDEGHIKAWIRLGRVAVEDGREAEAVAVLEVGMARLAAEEDADATQLRWRGQVGFALAKAQAAAGDHAAARALASGALGDMSLSGAREEKLEEIRTWLASEPRK